MRIKTFTSLKIEFYASKVISPINKNIYSFNRKKTKMEHFQKIKKLYFTLVFISFTGYIWKLISFWFFLKYSQAFFKHIYKINNNLTFSITDLGFCRTSLVSFGLRFSFFKLDKKIIIFLRFLFKNNKIYIIFLIFFIRLLRW